MTFQIKTGVPIPPAQRAKGKLNWLNTLKVGQSLHFDNEREFDNIRRALGTRKFKVQTRKLRDAFVIWITQEPD